MSDESKRILLGGTGHEAMPQVFLRGDMANRHGLVAGATGTGKTVTLQVLAEGFSRLGVPVFAADVKGDLSGISAAAAPHPKVQQRIEKIGITSYSPQGSPVLLWDVFGKTGHPVRTTISEMGPLLLSRLLGLNDTQDGVLHIAFRIADDQGLLLLDLKDLRAMLEWLGENSDEVQKKYGNVHSASIGAIQRRLLVLEEEGGDVFFGEPALRIESILQKDFSGRGVISLLDATTLMNSPRLYGTFLLWLLSELFEELEEIGDPEIPRLVFFFDEAHLLFDDAPKALLQKIEQVVRLIRSKGVGVFFVTQNPLDVPDEVAAQLGNRVQHALRAFTPRDQKAVKAAAETFRQNPELNTLETITNLGVGEALISCLDESGKPGIVERVLVSPPESRIGPLEEEERTALVSRSPLKGVYDKAVDRESAFELLAKRREAAAKEEEKTEAKKGSNRQSVSEAFFKSIARSIGSQVGRQLIRGILGSLGKGK